MIKNYKLLMMIKNYRLLTTVDRFQGKFKLRKNDLAHHSYFVALLFIEFAQKEGIKYGAQELEIIMKHDLLEVVSADLPWDVKNLSEETKKAWKIIEDEVIKHRPEFKPYSDENIKKVLNKEQYKLFKACDMLELWIFLQEEIALGNNTEEIEKISYRANNMIFDFGFLSILKFQKGYKA